MCQDQITTNRLLLNQINPPGESFNPTSPRAFSSLVHNFATPCLDRHAAPQSDTTNQTTLACLASGGVYKSLDCQVAATVSTNFSVEKNPFIPTQVISQAAAYPQQDNTMSLESAISALMVPTNKSGDVLERGDKNVGRELPLTKTQELKNILSSNIVSSERSFPLPSDDLSLDAPKTHHGTDRIKNSPKKKTLGIDFSKKPKV